jgi:hypothetical protein
MNIISTTKRLSLVIGFIALAGCGGSSDSDTAAAPAPGSAEQISQAQAVLDAQAGVSSFDYAALEAGRTSCTSDNVIDSATEISCYQAFLETLAPV